MENQLICDTEVDQFVDYVTKVGGMSNMGNQLIWDTEVNYQQFVDYVTKKGSICLI